MTALNLRNAVLLRRVQDPEERDALTGAANRRTFQASLQRALWTSGRRGARTSSVLFIDLDDFKTVNDSHGFETGDALLVAVTRRIESLIRDGDVLARLGGDEFAILTDDMADLRKSRVDGRPPRPRAAGRRSCSRRRRSPSRRRSASRAPPTTPTAPPTCVRNADVAMYVVKAGGKAGFAIFDPAMPSEIRGRHELATELQQAVDLDQLELRYQPIVNLQTGAMAGFEALVRWRHPERGLIAPGQFIEIAEEHGSILPIGRWVLREACRQVAAWSADGLDDARRCTSASTSRRARSRRRTSSRASARRSTTTASTRAPWSSRSPRPRSCARRPRPIAALTALDHLGVRVVIDNFGTRLLLAQPPPPVPGPRAQDRRASSRRRSTTTADAAHLRPRRRGRRDGAVAGHRDRRRGDRDRRPGRLDALARLHLRAGLLLRPPDARRGAAGGRPRHGRLARRGGRRGRGRRRGHARPEPPPAKNGRAGSASRRRSNRAPRAAAAPTSEPAPVPARPVPPRSVAKPAIPMSGAA